MSGLDLTSFQGRAAAFAVWFDLAPAPLTFDPDEPDQVLWTDALQEWATNAGIDFNWLVIGDPKLMAKAYREQRRVERHLVKTLGRLDEDEARLFRAAVEAVGSRTIEPEEVMEVYQAAVASLRAERVASDAGALTQERSGDGVEELDAQGVAADRTSK